MNVDAVGLAAVRLGEDGRLEALVAGRLGHFDAGEPKLDLPARVDVAIWRDSQGKMHGVLQGWDGAVPEALNAITAEWRRSSISKAVE